MRGNIRYKIYCSYLEIYNERIYDLLSFNEKNIHLDIREDKKRGLYVQDLTTVHVTKEEDIFKLMEQGAMNKSVAQTEMNERSSRSHTIFQMFIEQEMTHPKTEEEALTKVSKLNLVDLAGSEKWNTFSAMKMEGKRIQEMTSINQSLSTLGVRLFRS
jgi:phage anti-repressor protein